MNKISSIANIINTINIKILNKIKFIHQNTDTTIKMNKKIKLMMNTNNKSIIVK